MSTFLFYFSFYIMSSNPVVKISSEEYVPRYSTHWHLRFTDPTPEAFGVLENLFGRLISEGYLTYVCLSESTEENQRKHYHCAVGTSKSIKKVTLQRKLGLLRKEDVKKVCYCFYLSSVYNDSTPLGNYNYVKDGHKVLLELGNLGPIGDSLMRNIAYVFE